MEQGKSRNLCSSIVSVLAMSQEPNGEFDCLRYCLKSNQTNVGDWGHEYVRLVTEVDDF